MLTTMLPVLPLVPGCCRTTTSRGGCRRSWARCRGCRRWTSPTTASPAACRTRWAASPPSDTCESRLVSGFRKPKPHDQVGGVVVVVSAGCSCCCSLSCLLLLLPQEAKQQQLVRAVPRVAGQDPAALLPVRTQRTHASCPSHRLPPSIPHHRTVFLLAAALVPFAL